MRTFRGVWSLAGILAGLAGLATSYFVAMALTVRESPVVAVAELVIRLTPGRAAEEAIQRLGAADKPLLVGGILVVLVLLFAWAGRLSRRTWWAPSLLFAALAGVGAAAVLSGSGNALADLLPVAAGFVTWLVTLSLLTDPVREAEASAAGESAAATPTETPDDATEATDPTRRGFLLRAGVIGGAAVVLAGLGRFVGAGRRKVEATRRLLQLDGVTTPVVPARARIGVDGVSPWMTPNDDFYLIHTAIQIPAIEPSRWSLRIHGMVDRELVLSYEDLLAREVTEAWVTLNCVSNEVGGSLIGNAWWSGVRIAPLLAEAGVRPEADAVLQTSEDGWTCGTPLSVLTDERDAMLAVAMNGKPLPIEHGFPVRMIVPGLYGYVSATKWLVDIEVSRFDQIEAFWTSRGWSEEGPVKIASRIDVPRSGADLPAGDVRVAGVAWAQHTGIRAVDFSVDGGDWQPAELAPPGTDDTWVQWAGTASMAPGDHVVRVRATDKDGVVQTGVRADPIPDGATGWHEVDFTVAG